MKKYIVFLLLGLIMTSCATREEVVYFENAEELEGMENLLEYEPVIENNDVLRISVSSMNPKVVAPFQMNLNTSPGGSRDPALTGYLVDADGYIQFPVLGRVEVQGKTRSEVEQLLQAKIREYVTDAVVSARIVNFTVSVLGEVRTPGRVNVIDGRITVPQALAQSGDITYNGKRENVLVIREVDGVKSVGRLDMTENDIFKSPFYYLRQNDIVYVEPTYRQVKAAGFITSYTGIISIITSVISLYLIFTK